ncbi:MAG: hypothetical protein RSD99_13795 [Janthinobacterium sp.]
MGVIVIGLLDPKHPPSAENLSWASIDDALWRVFGAIFDEVLSSNHEILSSITSGEFITQEVYSFQLLGAEDFLIAITGLREFFADFTQEETPRDIAAWVWRADIEPLLIPDYRYARLIAGR